MALITLIDYLPEALQGDQAVSGLFLDFCYAFHIVDHEILLIKLHHYGVKEVMLDWLRNYSSNRTQTALYDDVSSEVMPIKCDVPQDQSWDLCYSWYICDRPNAAINLSSVIYADDT